MGDWNQTIQFLYVSAVNSYYFRIEEPEIVWPVNQIKQKEVNNKTLSEKKALCENHGWKIRFLFCNAIQRLLAL